MTTHPHPVDLSVHRRRRHPTASYTDRLATMKDRDPQVCTCGHRCITHGSYIDGQCTGVGQGPCGWPRCECARFAASGAVSTSPLIPVPDYTRANPAKDRTCPDCHAPPGEPCHWVCSTWWS